jgi:hypothetical protein
MESAQNGSLTDPYLAAFFWVAQRFFCAAAILARPSALMVLFFGEAITVATLRIIF